MSLRRLAITVPLIALVASPLAAQVLYLHTFRDVPESSPHYDAVENLAQKGIIEGYSDTTFRPFNSINRAEFTKIVVGSVVQSGELDGCRSTLFTDVRQSDWFARYVCVAKARGIVSGYSDGSFRPAAQINAAEAAKIVVKALRPISSQSPNYDVQDAVWYRPFIIALAEWNAIPLTIDSLSHVMTRGEMAEILYRLQEQRGKPSRTYEDFTSFWTSFVSEEEGVKIPYPKVAPTPAFDFDGAPTGGSLAYPGQSLWRLSLGARIDCPPTTDARCAEYEWIADGFSREGAEAAVDQIFTNPIHIAVQADMRLVGKRVIIYTEEASCTHKEALVIGPETAVRLHWFCGGDNRDFTSGYLFDYMAEHIEFFGTTLPASSVASSLSSSASSIQPSSSAPSSSMETMMLSSSISAAMFSVFSSTTSVQTNSIASSRAFSLQRPTFSSSRSSASNP